MQEFKGEKAIYSVLLISPKQKILDKAYLETLRGVQLSQKKIPPCRLPIEKWKQERDSDFMRRIYHTGLL